MDSRCLSLSKNPNCGVCSKEKEDIVLQYSSPVCGFVQEVTPEQAKCCNNAVIIDVRELEEWDAGCIENAKHIPLSGLMQGHDPSLPSDCEIILYCQKGMRGEKAAQILKAQGYLNINNMSGGYEAWLRCKGS